MQKGQSGRDIAIGAASASAITYVAEAYTVLPTDRVIVASGTGTYTITLCPPSEFPANEDLLITVVTEGTGEVTVSTPAGGLFATPIFAVDGLTAAGDYKWLRNLHGVEWMEVKEVTT